LHATSINVVPHRTLAARFLHVAVGAFEAAARLNATSFLVLPRNVSSPGFQHPACATGIKGAAHYLIAARLLVVPRDAVGPFFQHPTLATIEFAAHNLVTACVPVAPSDVGRIGFQNPASATLLKLIAVNLLATRFRIAPSNAGCIGFKLKASIAKEGVARCWLCCAWICHGIRPLTRRWRAVDEATQRGWL